MKEKIVAALIYAGTMLATALLITVVLLEWVVGCGEVTYLPDNTWYTNECLFIPHEQKTGTW